MDRSTRIRRSSYAESDCGVPCVNTHLSVRDLAVLLLTMMRMSKGVSGVTSAGFVVLAAAPAAVQRIPLAGLVLCQAWTD